MRVKGIRDIHHRISSYISSAQWPKHRCPAVKSNLCKGESIYPNIYFALSCRYNLFSVADIPCTVNWREKTVYRFLSNRESDTFELSDTYTRTGTQSTDQLWLKVDAARLFFFFNELLYRLPGTWFTAWPVHYRQFTLKLSVPGSSCTYCTLSTFVRPSMGNLAFSLTQDQKVKWVIENCHEGLYCCKFR